MKIKMENQVDINFLTSLSKHLLSKPEGEQIGNRGNGQNIRIGKNGLHTKE